MAMSETKPMERTLALTLRGPGNLALSVMEFSLEDELPKNPSEVQEKHMVYAKGPIPLTDPLQQFFKALFKIPPEPLAIVNIVLTVPDILFITEVNGQVLTPTPEEFKLPCNDHIVISADIYTIEFLLKVLQEFVDAYKKGERGIFIDKGERASYNEGGGDSDGAVSRTSSAPQEEGREGANGQWDGARP